MDSTYIVIAMGVIIAIAIAEEVVSSQWRPWYFRTGLPVYQKRGPLRWIVGDEALVSELNRSFPGDFRHMPLEFKCIAPYEISFRENLNAGRPVGWRSPRMIRAHIRLEPNEHTFTITGIINWWALAMLLAIGLLVAGILLLPGGTVNTGGMKLIWLVLLAIVTFSTLVPYFQQMMLLDRIAQVIETFTGS